MPKETITASRALTPRQQRILSMLRTQGTASNQELVLGLGGVSRITVVRDLSLLVARGLIAMEGQGRGVRYRERLTNALLRYVDVEAYFATEPDERALLHERFNADVFPLLRDLIEPGELAALNALNAEYRRHIASLPPDVLKKEFERLTIDLSWKSSHIEGNTYSLIDTEVLITEHREAPGHRKEEATMILNHKAALDFIRARPSDFRTLTLHKVVTLHDLIVRDLAISRGFRRVPVGIGGTRYRPLDNEHQIREAMERTVRAVNKVPDQFSKALVAVALLSSIQPFTDGNKRTARMLGDALLLAHGTCPLSFRNVDVAGYKKALILFYEQNTLRVFKELFLDQFRFAVGHYFLG